jgi:hypothetical protein
MNKILTSIASVIDRLFPGIAEIFSLPGLHILYLLQNSEKEN